MTAQQYTIGHAPDPAEVKALHYNWDNWGRIMVYASIPLTLMDVDGLNEILREDGYGRASSLTSEESLVASARRIPNNDLTDAYSL